MAITAVHAAVSSATFGGTPIRGRARFSAPKREMRKKRYPAQGRGCTITLYQGSKVASTARTTRSAMKHTLRESRVVLAQ